MNLQALALLIKQGRVSRGMTQAELSFRAGISLPGLQNIEATKGNPSLETMNTVLGALGFDLIVKSRPADWDALARCGAPLVTSVPATAASNRLGRAFSPTRELLLGHLRDACFELMTSPENVQDPSRKKEAVQALLLALKIDFPTFFSKYCEKSALLRDCAPSKIDGRLIKLKRLASARLAEYL